MRVLTERTATLLVALAAAGWGSWSLFSRGTGIAPIWQSSFILLVIGLASLLPALRATRSSPRRGPFVWSLLLLYSLFEAGNYVLFFSALERGPVGVAVLAHYLAPVIVAALAPLLLREPLSPRTPLALAASLAGLSMLMLGSGGAGASVLPTALLGAGSALFYGVNTIICKRLLGPFSGSELLSYHCLVSALLLAGAAPLVAGPAPALGLFLGKLLAGSLLVGWGAGTLFFIGLKRIPAQRAAVLTYAEPLVAALVGVAVWGERLSVVSIAGAALIVAGGIAVATTEDESVERVPGN